MKNKQTKQNKKNRWALRARDLSQLCPRETGWLHQHFLKGVPRKSCFSGALTCPHSSKVPPGLVRAPGATALAGLTVPEAPRASKMPKTQAGTLSRKHRKGGGVPLLSNEGKPHAKLPACRSCEVLPTETTVVG